MSSPPTDPKEIYEKLVALLHEACKIEQALMVQYLYASFSIKTQYELWRGQGTLSEHRDLLGVAIEEMRHLHIVVLLLNRLGKLPDLAPIAFPFKSIRYPFTMDLEPLSTRSLAHYVFVEAKSSDIDPTKGKNPKDPDYRFISRLYDVLGHGTVPNLLEGLYKDIIDLAERLSEKLPGEIKHLENEFPSWIERLKSVQGNGLEDHFKYFRNLFMRKSNMPGYNPEHIIWDLPITHENYPSRCISVTLGQCSSVAASDRAILEGLVTLGNLHYWIVLGLLNMTYRYDDWRDPDDDQQSRQHLTLAQNNMRGPLVKLGLHLADRGVGLPFAPFPDQYLWENKETATDTIRSLIDRADKLAHEIDHIGKLPYGFKLNIYSATSSGLVFPMA